MSKVDPKMILEKGRKDLEENGQAMPVLWVETDKELEIVFLADLPANYRVRHYLFEQVGAMFRGRDVVSVSFVTEAYVREMSPEEFEEEGIDPQNPRLDHNLIDDPKAEECLMVSTVDKNGKTLFLQQRFEKEVSLEQEVPKFKFEEIKESEMEGGMSFVLEAFWKGVRKSN